MARSYNLKGSLQSLLGYGRSVHIRHRGICQYCGYGIKVKSEMNFDLWRQLTVEHLIGRKGGGYLHYQRSESRIAVERQIQQKFPELSNDQVREFVNWIDETNTVTACHFCNSTTSKDSKQEKVKSMKVLLEECNGGPEEVEDQIKSYMITIFERRKNDVKQKLEAAKDFFQREVEAELKSSEEE